MRPNKLFSSLILLTLLSGCSWNTYTKSDGSTGLRATHSLNQAVYYEDGTYSSNMTYNQYHPIRHNLPAQSQTPTAN